MVTISNAKAIYKDLNFKREELQTLSDYANSDYNLE